MQAPSPFSPLNPPYLGCELDSNARMIRLLSVLPGQWNDPIRCKLTTAYLSAKPSYEALSYCWGTPEVVDTVYCNDVPVRVTTNLRDALRRLRGTESPKDLWADALCINQQDEVEKGAQVRLMRDIYRECTQVIVWLGESDIQSREGFALLRRLSDARLLDRDVVFQAPDAVRVAAMRTQLRSIGWDSRWDSFGSVLARPYFQRTWIIQEITLAPNVVVYCGGDSIGWHRFKMMPALMIHIRAPEMLCDPQRFSIMSIDSAGMFRGTKPLFDLLMLFNCFLASNPRDKIYGLLGIASDWPNNLNIPIDYGLNPAELYRLFAVAMLERCDLKVLSAPRPTTPSNLAGLPSWAPDLSQASTASPFARDGWHGLFQASQRTRHVPDPGLNMTLRIQGMDLDKIELVGEFLLSHDVPPTVSILQAVSNYKIPKMYLNWASLVGADTGLSYREGGSMLDAYWQCLVAGCHQDHRAQTKALFHHWFLYFKVMRAISLLCSYAPHPIFDFITYSLFTLVLWCIGWLDVSLKGQFDSLTTTAGRKMVTTTAGWIGLAPVTARPGDCIVIAKGGDVPLLLRKKLQDELPAWEFLGEIYVHGIMDGRAFDADRCEPFHLI